MSQIDSTTVPGQAGRSTSRIGLGLATLMREGSRARRQRVLDAAYDAGIRHFDVAPLYGLGIAESELGRWLPRTLGDVSVATKFGLRPSASSRVVAKVQSPLRQILARSDRIRALARTHSPAAVAVAAPKIADVHDSVRRSLKALNLEFIDVLLLHDMTWAPAVEELWGELSDPGALPEVGALGITGDTTILEQYPESFLAELNVLQLPSNSKVSNLNQNPGALVIEYGLLSTALPELNDWLDEHESKRRELEDFLGQEFRQKESRASLLAALTLSRNDSSILLVGSTQPSHIESICAGVGLLHPILRDNKEEFQQLFGTLWENQSA